MNETVRGGTLKILTWIKGMKSKRQGGTELIKHGKRRVIEKYGEWTAHNIQITDDIYTIDNRVVGDEIKLKRIVQIVSDIACRPLRNLRILDLACLEGLYAVEFARKDARVVGIEGREPNIEKARFVRDVLSLKNLELYQDDVRNLNSEKYDCFDVVLCLGILYHINVPDVFTFVERIAEVCKGFTIIDTHISLEGKESVHYNGKTYWGCSYDEHSPTSTERERERSLWASLDNPRSFWFTQNSLYNLLSHSGFTSVYECHNPVEPAKPCNRVTLLAVRGQREALISSPLINSLPETDWPETELKSCIDEQEL